MAVSQTNTLFFFLDFIYLLLERGREGGREGEKHQYVVASRVPHTGDLACNPGMCPDWELNHWLFGLQAGTHSTEPHLPGHPRPTHLISLTNFVSSVRLSCNTSSSGKDSLTLQSRPRGPQCWMFPPQHSDTVTVDECWLHRGVSTVAFSCLCSQCWPQPPLVNSCCVEQITEGLNGKVSPSSDNGFIFKKD